MIEIQRAQRGKKSKKPDKRPARLRYWLSRHLERNKVRRLMKYCGMTKQQALDYWNTHRQGRVKDGYIYKAG
jgi:hypothetical protein